MGWQDISTAKKDENVPILIYFDHAADPYDDPARGGRLTDYAAIAEGGDYLSGKGISIAVWRDGYHANDGWEAANDYWIPGGWFAWLNGDAADHVANALFWQPLPEPPHV